MHVELESRDIMSEDVYAKPELTRKVRFQASDKDKTMDEEQDVSNVNIYDNYLPEGSFMSTSRENLTEEQQTGTYLSVYLSVCCKWFCMHQDTLTMIKFKTIVL